MIKGNYTEFHFRAHVKDGPVADWLERTIGDLANPETVDDARPYEDHPFFQCHRWRRVMNSAHGGDNSHISVAPIFDRDGMYGWKNKLLINSVLKNYDGEIAKFVDWIRPYLYEDTGAFLGYSNAEDAPWDELDEDGLTIEQPVLYRAARVPQRLG